MEKEDFLITTKVKGVEVVATVATVTTLSVG